MQFEYPVQCRETITPEFHDEANLRASFPILSKELIVASRSDGDRFLNYALNAKDDISMFALAQYIASEFQRSVDGIWCWIVNGVYKTPPILSRTFTFTPRAVPISVCTNETYMTIQFDVVCSSKDAAQEKSEKSEKTRLRSCIIFFDDENNMCVSKGKEICFEYSPSKSLFVKETPLSVRFGVRDALKKHKVSRVCLMLIPAKDSRAEWAPWISHDVPVVASSYIKRDVFARYPPWSIDPRAVYWAMSALKPSMQFVFRCCEKDRRFTCVGTYNDFSGRIQNGYTEEFQGTGTFLLPITRRFMLMTRDSDPVPAHDLMACSVEDYLRLLEDVRKRIELAFQNAPSNMDEETELLSYLEQQQQQREFVGDDGNGSEKKKKKKSSKKRRLDSSSADVTPTLALEGEQQQQKQQQQQQESESQPESLPESSMPEEQAPSDEAGA